MKILFNKKLLHWTMTGLLGKHAKWFLGFSRSKLECSNEVPSHNGPIEIIESVPGTNEAVLIRIDSDQSGVIHYRKDGSDVFQKIFFKKADLIQKAMMKITESN